jgi:hypothetical protein
MALSSPGVEVKVIDESFYTPAAPGTVPLVIVATAENKANSGGTGTAPGTLKANAGEVYLLTSQRDLGDVFGDPVFKTDANNNPIHAGEQNEYGLQTAYSLLGVSNRAFVVRADIDLASLDPSSTEPDSTPANGTHWLDTQISAFGIFEWNGRPATEAGGQKFVNKIPRVITDGTKVDESTGGPVSSAGSIGDYAVVAVDDANADTPQLTTLNPMTLWYRSRGVAPGQVAGQWVQAGSEDWFKSWPAVASSTTVGVLTSIAFTINGEEVNTGTSLTACVDSINTADITGVFAAAVNNKLELYALPTANGGAGTITIAEVLGGGDALPLLRITAGTYYSPAFAYDVHTKVPKWKRTGAGQTNRPTGSVWIKTTEPNLGSRWRVKRWNETTLSWERVDAPLYANGHEAIYGLDKIGGGTNLAVGQLYTQYNPAEGDALGQWKIWRRSGASSATVIKSARIIEQVNDTTYELSIRESSAGTLDLSDPITVEWTANGDQADAELMAAAINEAGFENIEAEVDSQNRVVITHKSGGDIRIEATVANAMSEYGFSAYDYEPSSGTYRQGTEYLLVDPTDTVIPTTKFIASNWVPLVYAAANDAPARIPEEGQLWYSSVIDEVDIMIHDGSTWVGYKSATSPYYANNTDPNGPIVSATAPEKQSNGNDLVTGDLWISTADMENFPQIYKFNFELENLPVAKRWILLDKSDQSTEEGVLFADARYNTSGANSNEPGLIVDLLTSDYLDPDAPEPALYPEGMLLWNLRRSGYNVKSFRRDYIDVNEDNVRFDPGATGGQSMANYYPHRWVTVSGNQDDGSGSFGRKAQRKVIVQALQATVNSNQQIRDEDGRIFNLIACPGYPELIGEMVNLNYDRGLTAFVVGDTPARLTPDATSLLRWGNNELGALEDNDIGATSFDEYMAMFYPWGFTSDNFGNNVVVPPSHMILRVLALNDQVAYPWFAPAGVRRGGITNATAVGYVNSEGEFRSVALNTGQRDTLYDTKINPITFFTGTGLVNYGQKTRARAASALDRINVARLVIYLRRQLAVLAKPYIFEPNDKITRDEIKAAVEALLLELVGLRALYDYLVVCDESNNTPSRIDRNELWIDIAIEPVKAVEFIYIPLRLKNTGEIAGL